MSEVEFLDISGEIQEDLRGFVFFPWQEGVQEPQELLRTFHLISIAPGQVRGNHLHPGHREYLFTFHGMVALLWEDPPGTVQETLLTGRRTLVRIPPGVPHALRNPGPEILYLLAWRERTEESSAEPETLRRLLTTEG
jgi:oxalate decarboxylase/phosphoglucose isomerase-like protein (cupin superfamily)